MRLGANVVPLNYNWHLGKYLVNLAKKCRFQSNPPKNYLLVGQTGRPLLFIWILKWYIYTRKLTSLMDSDGLLRKLCLSTFFAKWPHCAMVGKYQSNQTKSQNDVFFVTHSLLKIFKRKNTKTWYLKKIIHKKGWGGKNCGALDPTFGAFLRQISFLKK